MTDLFEANNDKSMMSIFSSIKDPRKPYNQKHLFMDIVSIVILAELAGADSWDEMTMWASSQEEWLKTFLTLENGIPSHDTLNRVFQMIDSEQLHSAFCKWTAAIAKNIKGVVAIDGKTVRRSKENSDGTKPIHVVSAWSNELSLVLGQICTEEKSNEITAIPALLELLDIKGCIVTIDAMGTQKSIAKKIREKEADYILSLKENQKIMYGEVSIYFENEVFTEDINELKKNNQYFVDFCQEHGRYEKREYYITYDIKWFEELKEWEGLKGFGARKSKDKN